MTAWFVHKMRLTGAIVTIALYAFCATQIPATASTIHCSSHPCHEIVQSDADGSSALSRKTTTVAGSRPRSDGVDPRVTPGSWWQHPKSGLRLVVPRWPAGYMQSTYHPDHNGKFPKRHGRGQPVGRWPAFQEGKSLYLAWLLPEEIRGAWRPCRPSKKGAVPLHPWIIKPIMDMNDFLFDGKLHVAVIGIRGHLVACTGMDPEPEKWTGFGDCRWTTFFLETREARERLRPKFATPRITAWDRIGEDDAGSASL